MIQVHTLDTGTFRLDGGAMFGVVPKTIWHKIYPADDDNRILMAMRSLLIRSGDRNILVDNGIGHKYDEFFKNIYAIDHSHTLSESLAAHGLDRFSITDLIITHLHFDHAGGTTQRNQDDGELTMTFPNAILWLQRSHLALANAPNPREQASFFADYIKPINAYANLSLLDGDAEIYPGISVKTVGGHTDGMQLPLIQTDKHQLLFAADLFPTHLHLPLPYVMSYDTYPLLTMQEKKYFLDWAINENITFIYQHDAYRECGKPHMDARGKYRSGVSFKLSDIDNTGAYQAS